MTDDMGFVTPFKSFSDMKSSNPIVQADQEMADAGKQDVSWDGIMFMPPNSGKTASAVQCSNTCRAPENGMR